MNVTVCSGSGFCDVNCAIQWPIATSSGTLTLLGNKLMPSGSSLISMTVMVTSPVTCSGGEPVSVALMVTVRAAGGERCS